MIGQKLRIAAKHHIESFNFVYTHGLQFICKYLSPMEITHPSLPFVKMTLQVMDLQIGHSTASPSECRQTGKTYTAPLLATLQRQIDDSATETLRVSLGEIPILVMSDRCRLSQDTEQEEDTNEFGGYFIVNGNERIIRMLIIPKRNYPIVFKRPGFRQKGFNFSQLAVQVKSVREDEYSRTITLHYLNDGDIYLRLLMSKKELQLPVIIILKALREITDHEVYNMIVRGRAGHSEVSDRVEVMISVAKQRAIYSQKDALNYLGRLLRGELGLRDPNTLDIDVGKIFIREHILVHLARNEEKVEMLCLMIEKLYALVCDEINPDNLDSLVTQEVLLGGHLYTSILREKVEELLFQIRERMIKDGQKGQEPHKLKELNYIKRQITLQTSIGAKLENFLATGSLRSQSGLDLLQASGFTIVADKLNNMRFLSHFRSVHRGAFFTEMKTTTVRKLLPETWGFLCPVHTPDGGPCGLLNHITMSCVPLTHPDSDSEETILSEMGAYGVLPMQGIIHPNSMLKVIFNGKVVGYMKEEQAENLVDRLRVLKSSGTINQYTEVAYLQKSKFGKSPIYPGIFIYTSHARLVRPVMNLSLGQIEWISPLEQITLSIACQENDIRTDTTYQEIDPAYLLSILAGQVPFLNYNQSPRNMYQCQMAKQTMGTPCHNFPYRFDNKMYRLITPQIPAVKCYGYEDYGLCDYPSGTNAVVAVISYTGYDMEDAMIICKSSYERGLGHGVVYKTQIFETGDEFKLIDQVQGQFELPPTLQPSGLPAIGSVLKKNSPMLALFDIKLQQVKVFNYKESEQAKVDAIAIAGDKLINYKLRVTRNPVIGDKFSSRHGQKGVLSILWPQTDMPFSEQGIVPDIIINPHAFPSRMTIGMLIESMAAKSGVLKGNITETHPFAVYENDDAVDYFGKQLLKNGFNYHGNEVLYSGIYGTVFNVDIYMGVVYYQRLRHMVSDKSQARSQGTVDVLTQQPIKGRKKGGGIRLGEMERDALIAHGVAFCLNDRLLKCSDYSEGYVCDQCGSLLSAFLQVEVISGEGMELQNMKPLKQAKPVCISCKSGKCSKVALPFVLRYLVNELAAMNIKVQFITS